MSRLQGGLAGAVKMCGPESWLLGYLQLRNESLLSGTVTLITYRACREIHMEEEGKTCKAADSPNQPS